MNFYAILVAALANMVIGSIWYNPKVLGKVWMKVTGLTEEELRKSNMVKIFGFSILFSILAAMAMVPIVIHQTHFMSMLMNEPGIHDPSSEMGQFYADVMAKYGNNFRTFKHGMLHGAIMAIFLILPAIGIVGLFERKSWKYIFLHVGYWFVSMMIMGGIISAWQ